MTMDIKATGTKGTTAVSGASSRAVAPANEKADEKANGKVDETGETSMVVAPGPLTQGPVLVARDGEDLSVLSARFQDALVRGSDLAYDRGARRFAFVANRFLHEARPAFWTRMKGIKGYRCRAGFHFNHVRHVQAKGLPVLDSIDSVLVLLAMQFEPSVDAASATADGEAALPAPPGTVTLTFAGGAVVRLEVECLEAEARDLTTPWPSKHRPRHES
ncbi:MAG: DUF2948 family protein [Alphaproteobacteria bacterium]